MSRRVASARSAAPCVGGFVVALALGWWLRAYTLSRGPLCSKPTPPSQPWLAPSPPTAALADTMPSVPTPAAAR